MPMLGDILADARSASGRLHTFLQCSDPDLASRLATAAEQERMGPSAYARMAIADFSRSASEDDWATLVSALRESDDPGTDCLVAMVHWRLTVPRCGRHAPAIPEVERGAT